MPVQACINKVNDCECLDPPILNLSAEAPDAADHLGIYNWGGVGALGDLFSSRGCLSWCWSTDSQQAADDCALLQAQLCYFQDNGSGGGGQGSRAPVLGNGYTQRGMYASSARTCQILCPDGSTFEYSLPAQAVRSIYPGQADAIATSLCLKRARVARFCLTTALPGFCKDEPVAEFLSVSGGVAPFTFTVTSGALPDGLTLTEDGILTGTPTTAGSFTYVITTADATGLGVNRKTFTTRVIEITTAAQLPTYSVGTPYSVTLAQTGAIPPLSWVIVSGSLPPGLTLHEDTGVIDGTPTAGGSVDVVISVQDEAT